MGGPVPKQPVKAVLFFLVQCSHRYIILLIRTFLTLEGIAGQVDPNFNIYEVIKPQLEDTS